MQELRQSTGITVRIGSAVDATDGVTPETTLALATADQAELLKHTGAATVDISGRTFAAITGCDGWYDLTLTIADTATLGMLTVVIQDSSLMAPIFKDFMVVTANYWDSKCYTDALQVDMVQCGGSTVAAGAIPNAAADAAGGLPISDAGALDLDTQLANTDEITVARMGALTDWLDGGRLDAILDLCSVEANVLGHVNTGLSAYDGPTDAEMVAAFTEIKGATWATGTDTLEHIRNKQTDIETDTSEIGTAGVGLTNLGGMSAGMQAEVNYEMSDVLTVDTVSEPPQGPPPYAPTLAQINAYIYFRMMNKNEETISEHAVYDAAGTTKVIKAAVSDVTGILTKEAFVSGA